MTSVPGGTPLSVGIDYLCLLYQCLVRRSSVHRKRPDPWTRPRLSVVYPRNAYLALSVRKIVASLRCTRSSDGLPLLASSAERSASAVVTVLPFAFSITSPS